MRKGRLRMEVYHDIAFGQDIPEVLRVILLLRGRDAARLQEEWFTDTDAVRDKAGLMERCQPASTSGRVNVFRLPTGACKP